jgi:hypothetical protein
MARNIHWGVNTDWPITGAVALKVSPTTKPENLRVYQYVVKRLGRVPEFWGRYIGNKKDEVSRHEVDYLFKQSKGKCRLLMIYNGADEKSVGGDENAGALDARKAIQAATKVGVPPGVMIWCDIEGKWPPSEKWFLGWWKTMWASDYAGMGGIYCRANSQKFYGPYVNALLQTSKGPQQTNYTLNPFAKRLSDRKVFMVPWDPIRTRLLWASQPQMTRWSHPKTDPLRFTPAGPPTLPGHVALWQYNRDLFHDYERSGKVSKNGLVDLDLADERAYELMWQAKTAAPPTSEVLE